MFHVTENFPAGGPITQVPVSWFNKVAHFLNNLIGDGATVDKGDPPVIRIDTAAIVDKLSKTGTPVDHSDTNADDDQGGSTWTWAAGGDNGIVITPYCEIYDDQGWHYFGRAKFTYSKDGLLVAAEGLGGRREIRG